MKLKICVDINGYLSQKVFNWFDFSKNFFVIRTYNKSLQKKKTLSAYQETNNVKVHVVIVETLKIAKKKIYNLNKNILYLHLFFYLTLP